MSGHHRVEAANRAGLTAIPCWVAELTDEEAFMQLVLSNAQSELSPLEIGIHALEAVTLDIGGKGQKGGLSAYAEQIGKSQPYVTQVRQAAEVLKAVKPITQVMGLLDKAKHLAAIHSLSNRPSPLPTLKPVSARCLVKGNLVLAGDRGWL